MTDNKLLEEARARFKVAVESETKQRQRDKKALRFLVPEQQWTDEERADRKGRPIVSISKLDQPRQLILNQMREADLGFHVSPLSEDANDETAEVFQGLIRDIERQSRGEMVRFWAFDRATAAGRGYYRIVVEDDPRAPKGSKDQRIRLQRILYQDGVYVDPAAEEFDYRDARFYFIVRWVTKDEFEKEWPKAKKPPNAKSNKLGYEQLKETAPEWVREEDYCVAEYWTRKDDIVEVSKICGWDILEKPYRWLGKYIPIVPVIGREIQPYDDERRYMGMIEPAMDSQKLHNFSACTLIEDLQVESKAPYIAPIEAIENFEDIWKNANQKNYPYLPYNWRTKGGEVMPAPQRAQVDTSRMQLAIQGLQMSDQFIQSSTSIYDPSLGRISSKERSGRAVLATQQQSDASTGHFLQNLADISMPFESEIYLDLIPKVYDRKGRVVRIIRGENKKSEPVVVGMPFVKEPNTGRPKLVRPNEPMAKTYDLQAGQYDVVISVGKNYQTRLQEGAEFTSGILEKAPELLPVIGDIVFEYRTEPGAKEIAKRLSKWREKQMPGLGEGEDGQQTPEMLEAENQNLKQQLQQAQQMLQAADMAMKTDEAKQKATIQKAQVDSQTTLRKAQMDNAARVEVANIAAKVDLLIAHVRAMMDERKAERSEMEAERGRGHEMGMAAVGSALEGGERPEAPEPSGGEA